MIWQAVDGPRHVKSMRFRLFRMVETQQQSESLGFVDSLEEHQVLEELLEETKPEPRVIEEDFHYLIASAFRYPPLRYGSRFGRAQDPSLFYGGLSLEATLIESAFYRWVFLDSVQSGSLDDQLNTRHTLFSVRIETDKGVALNELPFEQFREELTHPSDYSTSQDLGFELRQAEVEAFTYRSARNLSVICGAVFLASAIRSKRPEEESQWWCQIQREVVTFRNRDQGIFRFERADFLIDGQLPAPAPS